jgi:phosphatidylglycerol---prolipoprotein diacylglyceryl transferase
MPYIHIEPFDLGLVKLQPFGILLAIGVLFGAWLARVFVERHKMDEEVLRWFGIRVVISGFLGAHVLNAIFYEPSRLKEDPLLLIKVWEGISSYGGFIGGFAGFLYFYRKIPGLNALRWSDMSLFALVPGFMFGRIGCATVHDHMGIATTFPLAVDVPVTLQSDLFGRAIAEGTRFGPPGLHHDLGLYEVPLVFAIWIFVLLIARIKDRKDGAITAFVAVAYAVPRFFLEFLRREESDPRYFGFTPAQYFSMITLLAAALIIYKLYVAKKFTRATEPEVIDWDPPGGRPGAQAVEATAPKKKKAGGKGKKARKKR